MSNHKHLIMRKFYTNSLFLLLFGLLANVSCIGQIAANDDTFSVVFGANQVTAGNLLQNDTLNGSSAQFTDILITVVSTTNPGISIIGSNIIVAAGTPQGSYTLVYQICEVANPNNCDTASVTINTELLTNPDYLQSDPCNYYVYGNVSNNDTLNGIPVVLTPYYSQPDNVLHPATVTLTYIQNPNYPEWVINPDGSIFNQNGWYSGNPNVTLTYQLCEIANPTNCSVGYVGIMIFQPNVIANNDDYTSTPIDNTIGGTVGSVLYNDYSPCGGPNNLMIINGFSSLPDGFFIDLDGFIHVAIGTAPGLYIINYGVSSNMGGSISMGTAHVLVTGVSTVVANYDNFATNYPNTTTASVLNNDTLNGILITNQPNITISALNNPAGFTLNPNGTITINASVNEGTYTLPYKLCSTATSSDCYINYAYVVVFKNRIIGKVKFDSNSNGCDANDPYLNNIKVINVNGATTHSNYTNYNGSSEYYVIGDVGNNSLSVFNLPPYFTVAPAVQSFNFTAPGTTTAPDFCVSINSNVNDLEVILVPKFSVVPGLPAFYDVWYKNNGSTTLNGQVSLQYDSTKMSFLSSSPSPNATGVGTLSYSFSGLAPFEKRLITNVKLQIATPTVVNSGDIASITSAITPIAADYTPLNNSSIVNQTVVNSQDPNEIVVHEGATITLAKAQQDYLHYTIHFQNIGTSNAINIKVVNNLDSKLDWSTFELVGTSHNCRVKNENGHNEFLFEGINLPGTTNEPLSHGYVSYKVKSTASIAVGNVIPNTASIYFDYNAPITTNIASTTVVNNLANENFAFSNLTFYPNPVKNSLSISNTLTIDTIEITSILGQKMMVKKINELQAEIDLSSFSNGVYFVKVTSEEQEKTLKIVKE